MQVDAPANCPGNATSQEAHVSQASVVVGWLAQQPPALRLATPVAYWHADDQKQRYKHQVLSAASRMATRLLYLKQAIYGTK
jgi:hypothetical protein